MEETSPAEVQRCLEGRERAAAWNLWRLRGIRYCHVEKLRRMLGEEFAGFWEQPTGAMEEQLARAGVGESTAEAALEAVDAGEGFVERYRTERSRLPGEARLLHARDPEFPSRLLGLDDPPAFLYVYGDAAVCRRDETLSVVGSREADVRDVRRARRIVGAVASTGVAIVSGGALGIDCAAHEAALEVGGETVVFLPSGLDNPTPKSNLETFHRAVDGGAVVTEYPLDVEVRNYHFPRRNRLIAALGDATFVVRAGPDSGTMLTAEASREIGTPICALVGGLDEPLAEGCLQLVVDGAQAVRHADDILETYFPGRLGARGGRDSATRERAPGSGGSTGGGDVDLEELSGDARELVESVRCAGFEPSEICHADRIAEAVDWATPRLQTALLELELHGVCEKTGGAHAYRFVGI